MSDLIQPGTFAITPNGLLVYCDENGALHLASDAVCNNPGSGGFIKNLALPDFEGPDKSEGT